MKQPFLAAKIAFAVTLSVGVFSAPSYAGIPVIDGGNLVQNIMSAMESVSQTTKQIQEYQTQLQQYENQLQNSLAPAAYIWDQAQATMNDLLAAQDTLNYYQNQLGSLDAYLAKFQDATYYRSSPCYSSIGCSAAEWAALEESLRLVNESKRKSNADLINVANKQQKALKNDALTLKQLQSSAQGATGQLQAIGYANQFASNQANQLLQIRAMLAAQNNEAAIRIRAEEDAKARSAARAEQMRTWTFKKSPADSY